MDNLTQEQLTRQEQLIRFLRQWIHVPHWKTCFKIGRCEHCEREFKEAGV